MAKQSQTPKPKKERTFKFNRIFKNFKGKNPEEKQQLLESHACLLKPYQVQKLMGAIPVRNTA